MCMKLFSKANQQNKKYFMVFCQNANGGFSLYGDMKKSKSEFPAQASSRTSILLMYL